MILWMSFNWIMKKKSANTMQFDRWLFSVAVPYLSYCFYSADFQLVHRSVLASSKMNEWSDFRGELKGVSWFQRIFLLKKVLKIGSSSFSQKFYTFHSYFIRAIITVRFYSICVQCLNPSSRAFNWDWDESSGWNAIVKLNWFVVPLKQQ